MTRDLRVKARAAVGDQAWHDPEHLWEAAAAVLRRNDLCTKTKASPRLYPHQWSWDSAFIAIGLSHLDVDRAGVELRSLLDAQWPNGKVPHIVFDPAAPPDSYFPGREHWLCATEPPGSTAAFQTSGLIQPPMHAIAVAHIWH